MYMTKKILVVDDDPDILDAITLVLEDTGYRVESSLEANYILRLKNSNLPDLIILDVLLSGSDGRLVCKQLKKKEITRKIPVIMISAHPNVEQSVKDAGAEEFIPKPFNIADLLMKVEKYVS